MLIDGESLVSLSLNVKVDVAIQYFLGTKLDNSGKVKISKMHQFFDYHGDVSLQALKQKYFFVYLNNLNLKIGVIF